MYTQCNSIQKQKYSDAINMHHVCPNNLGCPLIRSVYICMPMVLNYIIIMHTINCLYPSYTRCMECVGFTN